MNYLEVSDLRSSIPQNTRCGNSSSEVNHIPSCVCLLIVPRAVTGSNSSEELAWYNTQAELMRPNTGATSARFARHEWNIHHQFIRQSYLSRESTICQTHKQIVKVFTDNARCNYPVLRGRKTDFWDLTAFRGVVSLSAPDFVIQVPPRSAIL